jgi:hypothetical protein
MPLGLAVLGLALLVAAFALYPRTTELPTPPYSTLQVSAAFHIFGIEYSVYQKSPTTAEMKVSVVLPSGTTQPAHAPTAQLGVGLPSGITFWHCPTRPCTGPQGRPIRRPWTEPLAFNSAGEANAEFFVKARNFGVISDGVTAAAAIPAVYYLVSRERGSFTGSAVRE